MIRTITTTVALCLFAMAAGAQTLQNAFPQETLSEARLGERALDRAEREDLQRALAWFGHYSAAIDGDIGPGSRRAMAAWQVVEGLPETGVLTTQQRFDLMTAYRGEIDALGLAPVTDLLAGIAIDMPAAQVEFSNVSSPFVHYDGKNGSEAKVLLISQPGDRARLRALFQIMQTLEIVPADASARLRRSDFTISGEGTRTSTYVEARLTDDGIKGFALVWPKLLPGSADRIAEAMRSGFTTIEGVVLDEDAGLVEENVDLLAGLAVRRPEWVRSGVFVAADGQALTLASGLDSCSRITVGDDIAATVTSFDSHPELVLLTPTEAAAPIAVADLSLRTRRIGSDVAVAGFAYGGRLNGATVTFGSLADTKGINGEDGVDRLELARAHGGAGGPVLDATGAVLGLLLPLEPGVVLPEGTRGALSLKSMAEGPAGALFSTVLAGGDGPMDAVDLAAKAVDITAKIACWDS